MVYYISVFLKKMSNFYHYKVIMEVYIRIFYFLRRYISILNYCKICDSITNGCAYEVILEIHFHIKLWQNEDVTQLQIDV